MENYNGDPNGWDRQNAGERDASYTEHTYEQSEYPYPEEQSYNGFQNSTGMREDTSMYNANPYPENEGRDGYGYQADTGRNAYGYRNNGRSYLDQPGYDNHYSSGYGNAYDSGVNRTAGKYPESQYGHKEQPGNYGNGFAIAALVLGITSIVLFWTMPIAMIISIVGIIMSIVAMSKHQSRGMSIAGMVTSIIGALLSILTVILVVMTLARLDTYDTFDSDYDDNFLPYPYAEEEGEDPWDKFEDFFDQFS